MYMYMYGTFSAYINVIYNIFLLTGSQSTKDTVPLELHPHRIEPTGRDRFSSTCKGHNPTGVTNPPRLS